VLEVLVGAPRGSCAWLLLALVVSSLPRQLSTLAIPGAVIVPAGLLPPL